VSHEIDDEDVLLYLLLGGAILYFLYKNNIFGAPAGAGGGTAAPALLPSSAPSGTPSTSVSTALVAQANSPGVALPPVSNPTDIDYGITDSGSWD
jgi:hypothetical protein